METSAPADGSGDFASSIPKAVKAQQSFHASDFARSFAPVARTLAALDNERGHRTGLPGLASVVQRIIAAALRVQHTLAQRDDGGAAPVIAPLRVSYLVPAATDLPGLLRDHYYPRLALLNGLPTLEVRPGLPLCALRGLDRTTHGTVRLEGLEAYLTAFLAHEHYHNEIQLPPAVPYQSVMEAASARELLDTSADPFGYATMIRAYGLASRLTRFGAPGAPMPSVSPEIASLFRAARNDCFLVRHRILGTSEPLAARLARSIRNGALKLLFEKGCRDHGAPDRTGRKSAIRPTRGRNSRLPQCRHGALCLAVRVDACQRIGGASPAHRAGLLRGRGGSAVPAPAARWRNPATRPVIRLRMRPQLLAQRRMQALEDRQRLLGRPVPRRRRCCGVARG